MSKNNPRTRLALLINKGLSSPKNANLKIIEDGGNNFYLYLDPELNDHLYVNVLGIALLGMTGGDYRNARAIVDKARNKVRFKTVDLNRVLCKHCLKKLKEAEKRIELTTMIAKALKIHPDLARQVEKMNKRLSAKQIATKLTR